MNAATTRRVDYLLAIVAPMLIRNDANRVEGPGYIAYRFAAQGEGSELVRLDLRVDELDPISAGAERPLRYDVLTQTAKLRSAVKRVARPDGPGSVSESGWYVGATNNGHVPVLRVELRTGPRWHDRFTLDDD